VVRVTTPARPPTSTVRRGVVVLVAVLVGAMAAGCDAASLNSFRVAHGMAPLHEPELSRAVASLNRLEAEIKRKASFVGEIHAVDAARLGLSWHPGCPVAPKFLRLLRLSYWGMDGKGHVGELIVNVFIADRTVSVFRTLWNEKFPIARMVTSDKFLTPDMFDAHGNYIEQPNVPDTVNATSSFMCRAVTRGSTLSQHSYGLAIDINPVQNPYVKGSLVIPLNGGRNARVPGTILGEGLVVRAMRSVGMTWGGTWSSLKDYMHFSLNGH
jgi:hypothetical protein